MANDLYKRAIARAIRISGGEEQLARYLQKDPQLIIKWSTRAEQPPVEVMQRLAELLRRELVKNHGNAGAARGSRKRNRAR